MDTFEKVTKELTQSSMNWLITGVAGFIGSNLLETLLKLNQKVTGLDNFSTGYQRNLDEVQSKVTEAQWRNFDFIEGDITDLDTCKAACKGKQYVLHQAALGSVPRSIKDPFSTNASNINGFLNVLDTAKNENVKRFVYAASSSTYGDSKNLPKVEDTIGRPLSPYAVTKYVNELYADVYARIYGFTSIGLRYFNVFGKRQDPNGAYAAVIPKWFSAIITGADVYINGDGETSRDFCFIDNCVQANIISACAEIKDVNAYILNVAFGQRTTLNELFVLIKDRVQSILSKNIDNKPIYRDFREGDVRHSLADISKAKQLIGYAPKYTVQDGLSMTADWYINNLQDME